ncbi:MAG: metallopeptidase family protein [Parcubacteria group bacterium]|jgi:predicted Zn-dependent protease with MMP-like domain
MQKVTHQEFERIVASGIKAIPEKFLRLMENVVIVVSSEPTQAQKRELKIRSGWTLFGLYEGVPQTTRGNHYTSVVPDKITIFQKPIEQAARDKQDMKEIVKNTVWHEIAHHFGLDEQRVRDAETRRKGNSSAG